MRLFDTGKKCKKYLFLGMICSYLASATSADKKYESRLN